MNGSAALKYPLKKLVAITALAWAGLSGAATLGDIQVLSGQGQALRAEIGLSAVSAEEQSQLQVRLLTPETYWNGGADPAAAPAGLTASIEQRASGQTYIAVNSSHSVDSEIVSLLLELTSPESHIVREYVVRMALPAPVATPSVVEPVSRVKVKSGDTLAKIAQQNKPAEVSLDRMVVAMYRANPSAFIGQNINRLKAGKILRLPSEQELEKLSQRQAAKVWHGAAPVDWQAHRNRVAAQRAPVAERPAHREAAGKLAGRHGGDQAGSGRRDGVLKLSKGDAYGGKSAESSSEIRSLREKMHSQEEEMTAQRKALQEKNDRIAMLEKNNREMQRLIELKASLAASAAAEAAAPATPLAASAPVAELPALTAESGAASAPLAESAVEAASAPVAASAPASAPLAASAAEPASAVAAAEAEGGNGYLMWGGIAAALLAAAGGGWFFWNKRKAAAKKVPPRPVKKPVAAKKEEESAPPAEEPDPAPSQLAEESAVAISAAAAALLAEEAHAAESEVVAVPEALTPLSMSEVEVVFDEPEAEPDGVAHSTEALDISDSMQVEDFLPPDLTQEPTLNDSAPAPALADLAMDFSVDEPAVASAAVAATPVAAAAASPAGSDDMANLMDEFFPADTPPQPAPASVSPAAADDPFEVPQFTTPAMPSVPPAAQESDPFDIPQFAPAGGRDEVPDLAATLGITAPVVPGSPPRAVQSVPAAPVMDDLDPFEAALVEQAALDAMSESPAPAAAASAVPAAVASAKAAPAAATTAPAASAAAPLASAAPVAPTPAAVTPAEKPAAKAAAPVQEFSLDIPEVPQFTASQFAADGSTTRTGSSLPPLPGMAGVSLDMDEATASVPPEHTPEGDHWVQVTTKLDLARAYQEMGDDGGAREILEEVLAEGDAEQRKMAEVLLQQLG